MARMRITTYKDMIDHLADYANAATDEFTYRQARRAIQLAYAEITSTRNWNYYFTRGRVVTVEPQTSSTITYTNSSRTVTLASGTWPSWVTNGTILIENVPYPIATNPTSTTIVLPHAQNPGANVAAGTSYTLYRDTYTLPIDFTTCDAVVNITNGGARISSQHPGQWLEMQRSVPSPGTPYLFSISGAPNYLGVMSMRFFPPPDSVNVLDFVYKRRPRQLNQILYSTGTVATTSGSVTVTGTGTSWTDDMIGSTIRFSAQSSTDVPTGPGGQAPALLERTIIARASATSLTVDADPAVSLTSNVYSISDPVDMEEGSMLTFFCRECEKQFRILQRMKAGPDEEKHYAMAMIQAFEADHRSNERQVMGGVGYPVTLADMPSGDDVG